MPLPGVGAALSTVDSTQRCVPDISNERNICLDIVTHTHTQTGKGSGSEKLPIAEPIKNEAQ